MGHEGTSYTVSCVDGVNVTDIGLCLTSECYVLGDMTVFVFN